MPENAIYVGRPTRWGNPFIVGDRYKHAHVPIYDTVTANNILTVFETYARDRIDEDSGWLEPLRDADYLACWCPLSKPCHVDIYLKLLAAPDHSSVGKNSP